MRTRDTHAPWNWSQGNRRAAATSAATAAAAAVAAAAMAVVEEKRVQWPEFFLHQTTNYVLTLHAHSHTLKHRLHEAAGESLSLIPLHT